MNYIDQNPVAAGLTPAPEGWKASGAYYKARNLPGLVDFYLSERQNYIKLLTPIPSAVAKLLPPNQLEHTLHYSGIYAEAIDRLLSVINAMPKTMPDTSQCGMRSEEIGTFAYLETPHSKFQIPHYLHYFTGTADYYIYAYDGDDTMYGMARLAAFPDEPQYRKFSLSNLKSNQFIQLDWCLAPFFCHSSML